MKIIIFGKNGQLGSELQRSLNLIGKVYAFGKNVNVEDSIDITDQENVMRITNRLKPNIIVNAAAYTDVNGAELDYDKSYQTNSLGPLYLANIAKTHNSLLIHFSADYIFDGKKPDPYEENDLPNPINNYGKTKLIGENYIKETGCNYLILRVSWLYDNIRNNFLTTMYKLALNTEEVTLVNDQFGTPTCVRLISDCLELLINKYRVDENIQETFHLAANGYCSWYDYGSYIFKTLHKNKIIEVMPKIRSVKSLDYKSIVMRPQNSRFNTNKFRDVTNITLPNWQCHVKNTLDQIIRN